MGHPVLIIRNGSLLRLYLSFRLSLDDDIWFRPWKYDEEDVCCCPRLHHSWKEKILSRLYLIPICRGNFIPPLTNASP